MEDAIERLAEHVVNTNLSDIPNKAIQSAKTYILDTIGAVSYTHLTLPTIYSV